MSDSPTVSWPEDADAEGVTGRQEEKEDEVQVEDVHSDQGEVPIVTDDHVGQGNEPSTEGAHDGSPLEPVLEDPHDGLNGYMDATIEPLYDIGELARELAKADEAESCRHVTTRKSGGKPTEFKVMTPSKSRSDAEFYRVGTSEGESFDSEHRFPIGTNR